MNKVFIRTPIINNDNNNDDEKTQKEFLQTFEPQNPYEYLIKNYFK